jgi:RecA/RadA recombinase
MLELSTGSTLFNLALSDNALTGLKTGKMMNLIGDSCAGKSFLALTILAKACYSKKFDKYKKYYDDVESACEFNMLDLFGEKAEKEIISPYEDSPSSETIEQFYYNIDTLLDKGEPFIYVLDSMDALTTNSESELFDDNKKAFEKGTQTKATYGDGKAKQNSANLRKIVGRLKETESILIIISQTRDNIGNAYVPKTRAGGKALKFYASWEVWVSVAEKLKMKVNGKDRIIGINALLKVAKNKVTGKYVDVQVPIYYSCGVDDVGSMIDWMVAEGGWSSKTGWIESPFGKHRMDALVEHIIETKKVKELKLLVQEAWTAIWEKCRVNRKSSLEEIE